MTAAEFKRKWARFQGKESAAYQSHFDDLCRLLGVPTPLEADPTGEFFCFQKRVVKDAELFDLEAPDASDPTERGFADVWKKGCFGWEYKGKKKNLDEAYKQLLRYREALENPPLLVVCDFDRFIIKTNFNGTVQKTHEFTNDQIDRPENLRLLRACFEDPEFLKPQRTTAQVTEALAGTLGEVAKSLQKREAAELADAKTRAEMNFAQRKNLRIARFLNRIVFCFFAEDTGLLPKRLFSDLLKTGLDDPRHLAEALENLFAVMARGGLFGKDKIRHFNGHLFEDSTVFELTEDELRKLAEAAEADWQFIQPSIMGTLFQRALDESQRAALGAQYTGEPDIRDLVEPVLMAPLRREWAALKAEGAGLLGRGGKPPYVGSYKAKLEAFLKKLRTIVVMDPACGSGNFLYVALQLLLDLEKEVITFALQLGFRYEPEVGVHQLRAIEINAYAYELAQVSVQIGYLQWRRNNGFDNDRSPVLQNLDGFHNEDALLVPHFRSKARTLKEAQAGEHAGDDALKFYTEREWPECDVIVGNPPFLGGNKIRDELGPNYLRELWRIFENRVAGASDLCCYWFEKAREHIKNGGCRRVGLLATQSIRGGVSRSVLANIRNQGGIFFAVSDKAWVLDGADVRVSMIGFDDGSDTTRTLDGITVLSINPNLTADIDFTGARPLKENAGQCFQGSKKVGAFDVEFDTAVSWLAEPNPHPKPNSDVLRPCWNGIDLVRRNREMWLVDFGLKMPLDESSKYSVPFAHVLANVKPEREKNRRDTRRTNWWKHGDGQPAMRNAVQGLTRFLATPEVAKHRVFGWISNPILPDCKLMVVAREDDFVFGLLQSRFHELWALRLCTWHGIGDDPRYTPSTCFDTFPFPFADDLQPPRTAPVPPVDTDEPLELNGGMARMVEKRFLEIREEPPAYGGGDARPSPADGRSRREEASSGEARLVTSTPTGPADASLRRRLQDDIGAPEPPEACRSRREEASSGEARLVTSTPTGPADASLRRRLQDDIAAAAKELNELRERWLNPPEWTRTEVLEFPASVDGPWARYIDKAESGKQKAAIGLARYPRLVPKDAECAELLKKRTLTKLYNERPAWLDLAHRKLDAAVAAAYGWADLTTALEEAESGAIYDFKTRTFALLDATGAQFAAALKELQKAVDEQILERLLALNLERAAQEAKAAKVKQPKGSREKGADELL